MGSEKIKTEASNTQDVLRSPAQVASQFSAALPNILKAVQEFQPGFNEAALQEMLQFAPQFAQAEKETFAGVSPFQAELPEALSKVALTRTMEGLTPEELQFAEQRFKSLAGSQVNAPIGARDITRSLIEQQLAAKSQGEQLGLALSGRVPMFGSGFVPQSNINVGAGFGSVFSPVVFGQKGSETETKTFTPSILTQIGQGLDVFSKFAGGIAGFKQGFG
jgi:hypothetical protein